MKIMYEIGDIVFTPDCNWGFEVTIVHWDGVSVTCEYDERKFLKFSEIEPSTSTIVDADIIHPGELL